MDLILNTYGIDLMVKNSCFHLVNENTEKTLSPSKIDSIFIATGITLSSNAIQLALENNIPIQFTNYFGESYGKIWHTKFGSIATIRKNQLKLSLSRKSGAFAKKIVLEKSESQIKFLKRLQSYRNQVKKTIIDESIFKIRQLTMKIENLEGPIDKIRNQLMGYEGNISKKYFETFQCLLPKRYTFKKRSRKPSKDAFNAFLNYGYGVLYSKSEFALIKAGIDPYIGIYHVDNYNRKAFLYDFVEKYRVIVDDVVLRLFTRKEISSKHYKSKGKGIYLSSLGRKLLLKNLNKKFKTFKKFNKRQETLETIIQLEAYSLASNFKEEASCLFG